MEFVDEVVIFVRSGDGGAGAVSFRREKYVPRGGPDGGDGGHGGALVLEASARRNTLIDYARRRHHRAEGGRPGAKKQMYGAGGADLVCEVPVGTLVFDDETGDLLADLDVDGARWALPGGRGGLGNMHFATATNRTPRFAQPGEPGTEMVLRLELKLLADVGLLGFPNAGKSTFLSRVSAARPRVADYPFTTLVPQLGVVELGTRQTFVVADIPGLIEGAADGAGLGHQFLRHVERCACYLHLVSPDPWEASPADKLVALDTELELYGAGLPERPQVVALNKIDTLSPEELATHVAELEAVTGGPVYPISGVTGQGVPELVAALWAIVEARREAGDDEE
ncbi:MAG: GTPase ObgE [Alphaproteobacteria bacterium]|nr:GTPase ObgE [Alphaproteobacteria bacterium]